MTRIMQMEREKNASTFTALSKFCNLYLMLTLRNFAGLHLLICFISLVNGKTTAAAVSVRKHLSCNWNPEPLDVALLLALACLYTRHIKQGKTSTWIVSTKLCICVWQAMKLLNFFHPYPFKIFFSLSYCLLHSLWPILDLILTSSRPRLFFPCVLYRVKIVLDIK